MFEVIGLIEVYLRMLDGGYFEIGEAFKGLANENVWKRPAEGLLSVGEIAGHIAYWEALRFAGEGEDLASCRVSSPLIDVRFRYYTSSITTSPSDKHLAMTAQQVYQELLRVHTESVACIKALNPDMESTPTGQLPGGFTYGSQFEYMVFHIGYHTGQMYSVRHLLGEKTPDN
ncbi:MAG: DinB family protein [Chthonomonadales bacterium]